MFTVFVDALEFYGHHGVDDAERQVGHRFIADIELDVQGTADRSDRIEDTVSYAEVAQLALLTSSVGSFHTVERLAHEIAAGILKRYPKVSEVRIRLAKRLPPADLICESVGVELTLER